MCIPTDATAQLEILRQYYFQWKNDRDYPGGDVFGLLYAASDFGITVEDTMWLQDFLGDWMVISGQEVQQIMAYRDATQQYNTPLY